MRQHKCAHLRFCSSFLLVDVELRLNFTGATPSQFPYGDLVLLKALGYNTTYGHPNEMSGGNYEMSSFAFVFDSDYTTFNNLIFDSATHDNNHLQGCSHQLERQRSDSDRGWTIANMLADRRGSTGTGRPVTCYT
jgi:hypothetical protein